MELKPGDEYQGGIIFWLDETKEHGLIASKQDLSGEADWDEAVQYCAEYNGWRFFRLAPAHRY
jgi:hypothetical protein